jgi:hypothetical protein
MVIMVLPAPPNDPAPGEGVGAPASGGRRTGVDKEDTPPERDQAFVMRFDSKNRLRCLSLTNAHVRVLHSHRQPAGAEWFHEIKYDGYRLRVERDGDRVRLITRGGYDWTKRFPWIAEAALKNRRKQFVIDGEAVVLGVDGVADFNALHSGRQNDQVQFCAFDVLAIDGEDVRDLPLSMRTGRSGSGRTHGRRSGDMALAAS